ncbi:MAG TPA: T9SS type A sorting domain-containing protein, partial [Flavisolibacter sp.]|nr:T9SS type A sorting domain-containing protein [Flavisolibacter sp.]
SGSNCYGRYGDYNHLVIDPADNSTYWFTAMYNTATYWSTKIGSFSFAGALPTVSRQRINAEEQKIEKAFGVYPNPAHDRLTVTFPLTVVKPVLQVLDMNGKLMASYKISGSQHVLTTTSLAPGIYLLKMSAGSVVRYLKFVKE